MVETVHGFWGEKLRERYAQTHGKKQRALIRDGVVLLFSTCFCSYFPKIPQQKWAFKSANIHAIPMRQLGRKDHVIAHDKSLKTGMVWHKINQNFPLDPH